MLRENYWCDKMTTKLSLFMPHFQVAYQMEQFSSNKFFDLIFSLESDKMTALGQNDSITFTFYLIFSNGIPP